VTAAAELWHGTRGGYVHHRCRCPGCRAAVVEYNRRRREARRERDRWRREAARLEAGGGVDLPAPPPPVDTRWMARGACRGADTNLFFPAPGQGRGAEALRAVAAAKALCAVCPVAGECLDYANATDQRFGVWGGLTAHERNPDRRIVRRYG
jgi:WhiB family redox-sensing transcriptional regulator